MKAKVLLFVLICVLISCSDQDATSKDPRKMHLLEGETMGTYFSLTYLDSSAIQLAPLLTELLIEFNQAVSTYIDSSTISIFNQNDHIIVPLAGYFDEVFLLSLSVYEDTEGWFDPTVGQLVNYWGFGYTPKKVVTNPDSMIIDSLKNMVGLDNIKRKVIGDSVRYQKIKSGVELDFSAVAKGFAVDLIAEMLDQKGLKDHFIDIGGEIRASGTTKYGYPWRSGIRDPSKKEVDVHMYLNLTDLSIATSGNYENYHTHPETGEKYAHTINPKTGYPEKNKLLSASVFTSSCGRADALATAFMASGLTKSKLLLDSIPEVDAYLIYTDETGSFKTYKTKKVDSLLTH